EPPPRPARAGRPPGRRCAGRQGRPAGDLRAAARSRRARRDDAGAGRLEDAGADPRRERRPRDDADRRGLRGREGAGARRGRRRLRGQAVRPAGARRARAGPAATGAGWDPGDAEHVRGRVPQHRLRPARRRGGRSRGVAHAARVQAPRRVRPPSAPGALAGAAARARLGRRVRRCGRPGEALRGLPAPEARSGTARARPDRDRPWIRLPVPAADGVGADDETGIRQTRDERYREMAATEQGIRFFACAPLVAPGGERLGAVCVLDHSARDLTSGQADALRAIARQVIIQLELRRVSQAEGAARRRFRMLVEQLPGVTYIEEFGASSASYVSPQMEALNGWPPEEWAADPELFGKVLHPEDRERALTAFAKAHAAFDPIQSQECMVELDGWIVLGHEDSAVARDDDGTPLYLQGYMTDITLRKQSELELRAAQERYRTLAEQLPLVTYIDSIEIGGAMTYISPQIEDLVGYTAEEWLADPDMFTRCLHP